MKTNRITKKSTKIAIISVVATFLTILLVMSGVGLYFAFKKETPEPEVIVNPIDFSVDAWDGSSVSSAEFISSYAGRAETTTTIDSAQSFAYFVQQANAGETFAGKTIYLNCSIDLKGHTINSIKNFQGTFDGGFYNILNANINGNALFENTENATIKNVGLYNCTINGAETGAGLINKATNTNIESVFVRLGEIKGATTAGLVSEFTSNSGTHTITNSFVDASALTYGLLGSVNTNGNINNTVEVKNCYYLNATSAAPLTNEYLTFTKVISPTNINNFASWDYKTNYTSGATWCDYSFIQNSTELNFNYPVQSNFVKVYNTGSGYESVVKIGSTSVDATSLNQAVSAVEANNNAEINFIVEKVYVEEEAFVNANSTITISSVANTEVVRSQNNTSSLISATAEGSKIVLGSNSETSSLVLDGNASCIKQNNLSSAALITCYSDNLEIGSNVTLQNNHNNVTAGGAICAVDTDLTLSNITIKNCSASLGGAICAISTDELPQTALAHLSSTYGLKHNIKPLSSDRTTGTNVTLSNVTIEGTEAENGGCVYATGTATLTNCKLIGGTATNNGGAVYSGGNMKLTSCTVSNNFAVYYGGALYSGGTTTVTGTTFKSNTANTYEYTDSNDNIYSFTGAAGTIYSLGAVTLSSSTIDGSAACHTAGAIYATADVTLNNSIIKNSNVDDTGTGAIFASGYTVTLTNNSLIADVYSLCGYNGGALFAKNVVLDNSDISNSYMTPTIGRARGAAIYATNSVNLSDGSTISNCYFTAGQDENAGSAIYCAGSVEIAGSTIDNCDNTNDNALADGFVIRAEGDLTLTDATISNCNYFVDGSSYDYAALIYSAGALTVSGGSLTGCSSYNPYGRSLSLLKSVGALTIDDYIISDCSTDVYYTNSSFLMSSTSVVCSNSIIQNCSATGVNGQIISLYNIDSSFDTVSFLHCMIGNAHEGGGAILDLMGSSCSASITNCNFSSNTTYGGILSLNNLASLTLTNTFVNANSSLCFNYGSGYIVSIDGSNATLYDLNISNNTTQGGAALSLSGSLKLSNSIVSNNTLIAPTASSNLFINSYYSTSDVVCHGAGICTSGTITLVYVDVTQNSFDDPEDGSSGNPINIQNFSGGGIYNSGTLTLNYCNVANNSAYNYENFGYGGGIYNTGTLKINYTSLSRNSANTNGMGGGIYNTGTLTLTNSTISKGYADTTGGIYSTGSLSASNTVFTNNTATYNSADIYAFGTLVSLTDCTFTYSNHASSTSSAVTIGNTKTTSLSGLTFSNIKVDPIYICNTTSATTLSNITVTNCTGSITTAKNVNLTIENSNIFKNTASGVDLVQIDVGATFNLTNTVFDSNTCKSVVDILSSSTGTVSGCTFSNNTMTASGVLIHSNVTCSVSDSYFANNTTTGNGAGVNVYKSEATITDCNFVNNQAAMGGAIYGTADGSFSTGSVSVSGSTFANNKSTSTGAAIYTALLNSASNFVLTIDSCDFSANTANNGRVIECVHLFLKKSTFTKHTNTVIYCSADTNIINCAFNNNSVGSNDLLTINTYDPAVIAQCSFTYNTSSSDLINSLSDFPSVYSSIFDNNTASRILFMPGAANNLANCTFSNSTLTGPAVYTSGGWPSLYGDASIANCNFINNTSTATGAALYIYDSTGTLEGYAEVTGCYFDNNSSPNHGAALYIYNVDVTVDDCHFTGNTVGYHGGAINAEVTSSSAYGSLTISNSSFNQNTSTNSYGGAIYTTGTNSSGTAFPLTITNCNFNQNSALNSGAIFCQTATITGSTFNGNTAGDDNGAVRSEGALSINSSIFNNNYAVSDCGAISCGAALVITDSEITNNSSDEKCGGAFANSALTLNNTIVSGNSSVVGGGLFATGNITLNNSVICNNTASDSGAGVAAGASQTVLGVETVLYSPDLYITNTVIYNNVATNNAGGVAAFGNLYISNTGLVYGNTAGGNGSDIYIYYNKIQYTDSSLNSVDAANITYVYYKSKLLSSYATTGNTAASTTSSANANIALGSIYVENGNNIGVSGSSVVFIAAGYALTLAPNGGSISINSGTASTSNVTVYAAYNSKTLYTDDALSTAVTSIAVTKNGYTYYAFYAAGYPVIMAGSTALNTIWTSTSAATITAQYTLNYYSISYNLNGGAVSTNNPTSYTITTDSFTLANPTKEGYTFTGWSDGSTTSSSVTIAKGSYGNKSYTAQYTKNVTISISGNSSANTYGVAVYSSSTTEVDRYTSTFELTSGSKYILKVFADLSADSANNSYQILNITVNGSTFKTYNSKETTSVDSMQYVDATSTGITSDLSFNFAYTDAYYMAISYSTANIITGVTSVTSTAGTTYYVSGGYVIPSGGIVTFLVDASQAFSTTNYYFTKLTYNIFGTEYSQGANVSSTFLTSTSASNVYTYTTKSQSIELSNVAITVLLEVTVDSAKLNWSETNLTSITLTSTEGYTKTLDSATGSNIGLYASRWQVTAATSATSTTTTTKSELETIFEQYSNITIVEDGSALYVVIA